jgi:hypothetical protein
VHAAFAARAATNRIRSAFAIGAVWLAARRAIVRAGPFILVATAITIATISTAAAQVVDTGLFVGFQLTVAIQIASDHHCMPAVWTVGARWLRIDAHQWIIPKADLR